MKQGSLRLSVRAGFPIGVAALMAQGCTTMEKVAWVAGGGSAPLSVVDMQKDFVSFESWGDHSARLRTAFVLHESADTPLGDDVVIELCYPKDKNSLGIEMTRSGSGLSLLYSAGKRGEFIPEGEYARCKTNQGNKVCARMQRNQDFSLCLNPRWQDDLRLKGNAVEVSPAKIDLQWNCAGLGSCSWLMNGRPLTEARFTVKRVEHHDDAVAAESNTSTLWRVAGFRDVDMKMWREAGFTLDEASQWGLTVPPAEAGKWKTQGWPIPDGKAWWEQTHSMDTASQWKKAGFSPSEYAEWRDVPPAVASRWRTAGFSGEEAVVWTEDGVLDPARAMKGLRKGCRDASKALDGSVSASAAISNYTGRQLSLDEMRGLCKSLGICVRKCGMGKCGGSITLLFGDGKGFIKTCLNIDKTFKDALTQPK